MVVTPVSLVVAAFIARNTYQMFQRQSQCRGAQTALIEEMTGSQKVVQAFGHEQEALEHFDAQQSGIYRRGNFWGAGGD